MGKSKLLLISLLTLALSGCNEKRQTFDKWCIDMITEKIGWNERTDAYTWEKAYGNKAAFSIFIDTYCGSGKNIKYRKWFCSADYGESRSFRTKFNNTVDTGDKYNATYVLEDFDNFEVEICEERTIEYDI